MARREVQRRRMLFAQEVLSEMEAGFDGMREMILDLAASRAVGECSLYERRKVDGLVNGYFANGSGESALDWFLSFELWRSAVLGHG